MSQVPRKRRSWVAFAIAGSVFAGVGIGIARQPATPVSDMKAPVDPVCFDDFDLAGTAAKSHHKDSFLMFVAPNHDSNPADKISVDQIDLNLVHRILGDAYLLVRMMPANEMSPAQITRITTLAERFGVARFPTMVLLDSNGNPYAKSEIKPSGNSDFADELSRMQRARVARDRFLELARHASGLERARLLGKSLSAVGSFGDSEYLDIRREIISLDSADITGLKNRFEPAIIVKQIDTTIQNEVYPMVDRGDYQAAIRRIDDLIVTGTIPRNQLQLLLAFKGQLYFSLGDKLRAKIVLDEAITLDPTSESAGRARVARNQFTAGS